jgi:hypothetical protein
MNLTSIESTADGIDRMIDAVAPIIGVFFPAALFAPVVADALNKMIDEILGSSEFKSLASPDALASLTASKAQLATASASIKSNLLAAGVSAKNLP